jgi:hypothetical protein
VPQTAAGPPPERLVQFGGVDAMQPDQLIGDHGGVAVDDLGGAGQAIRLPNRCGAWCPCARRIPIFVMTTF